MAGDEAETLKSYRIFNSLLDKWEIGYPLSEALVLDTLRSFQRHDLGHEKAVRRLHLSRLSPSAGPS